MGEEAVDRDGGSMPRKVFVRTLVGTMGAAYAGVIGYPLYRYLATPARREAMTPAITEIALPEKDLPGPGTALSFMFGRRPALLIHHKDGSMVCFEAVCTHLGCTVQFQPDNSRIFCPCHGGEYDMTTGKNVAGPPPKPLKPFHVEAKDGQVIISRA